MWSGPHEVMFADAQGHVHARRWRNRWSGLAGELRSLWGARVRSAVLTEDAPAFESAG